MAASGHPTLCLTPWATAKGGHASCSTHGSSPSSSHLTGLTVLREGLLSSCFSLDTEAQRGKSPAQGHTARRPRSLNSNSSNSDWAGPATSLPQVVR